MTLSKIFQKRSCVEIIPELQNCWVILYSMLWKLLCWLLWCWIQNKRSKSS